MLKASFQKYRLHFKEPSGTSRGILLDKDTYFIRIGEEGAETCFGLGECALFRGLSAEDRPDYEEKLREVCNRIAEIEIASLQEWSSIRFGVEMAFADLRQGGKRIYFPSAFSAGEAGIEINGLIWMGDRETMLQRIRAKLDAGFHCIKVKIGAIDFQSELDLLKFIRRRFGREDVELRVDANGAFAPETALERLDALAKYDLHSIEQPIRQGQWREMARLCARTPVPIALDEELIGVNDAGQKRELLEAIRPRYIILKPALAGGFSGTEEWIRLAEVRGIGWWVTSALESNIGLSALAQWTYGLQNPMPQGLGTGLLYTNNIPSPLQLTGERLYYRPQRMWDLSSIS